MLLDCITYPDKHLHHHSFRPFAAIVGGSKVSSKISVIEAMLSKVDKLVLGGGMVFTFLKARGIDVGNSLVEDDQLELARKLEVIAKEKGVELFLATDVVVADKFAADAAVQVCVYTYVDVHICTYSIRCYRTYDC
jgi:phosphoglycerate kinase